MPVFIYFVEDRAYYGIPIGGQQPPDDRAVKVARHHGGATTTADEADRVVGPADEEDIRWYLRRHLPGADGPMEAAKVCLYTNTPDDHFVIDRHPAHPRVLIAGGFSGHGFKFAPVVGEVIADLVTAGATRHPIGLFAAGRPTS
jgi:glycine/D-amino acid oxidase-like deaminating enzyme